MIDPTFWSDSNIIALSLEARLLYIGLWNYADDYGYFLDDVPAIKRTLFPDQPFPIDEMFSQCARFLEMFHYKEKEKRLYAWRIRNFGDWQKVDHPTKSKIQPLCSPIDHSEFEKLRNEVMSKLNTQLCETTETQGTLANTREASPLSKVKLREVNYKSPAENAGAVDNSKPKTGTGNPFEPVIRLAAEIGGKDKIETRNETSQKLVQWAVSMLHTLKGEPQDRILAVTKSSLEIVGAKIDSGYEIKSLWGLLTTIFDKERTKYIQGPENERYKNEPMGKAGDILRHIAFENR